MNSREWQKIYNPSTEKEQVAEIEFYRSLFLLSGWTYTSEHEIKNAYYGHHSNPVYCQPWLMVITQWGPVSIGWRKHVLQIEWSESKYSTLQIMEDENVTNEPGLIHAWGYEKAIAYLKELKLQFGRQDYIEGLEEPKKSKEIARFAQEKLDQKAGRDEWELKLARELVVKADASNVAAGLSYPKEPANG